MWGNAINRMILKEKTSVTAIRARKRAKNSLKEPLVIAAIAILGTGGRARVRPLGAGITQMLAEVDAPSC